MRQLFIGNRGAGWASQREDFKPRKPRFAAPFAKVGTGVVERIAEFDQPVERHQQAEGILPTGIFVLQT